MGWFGKLIFILGVLIVIVLLLFNFSDTIKIVLISIVAGIVIFVLFTLISAIGHLKFIKKWQKDKFLVEKVRKRRIRNRIIGVIILIVSIILFLNSYLYIGALMGNDMRVSLSIDNENFVMKNGEEGKLIVTAKVLTNPFCESNCSIILDDLSKNETISYENVHISVSSPFSKEYIMISNFEEYGQNLYKISLECNTIRDRFCYTASSISKSRTKIISVDHELSDKQRMKKEELKNETETISNKFYVIKNELNKLNINSSYLDLSKHENESKELNNLSNIISYKIDGLGILYENQEYFGLETEIPSVDEDVNNFEKRYNTFYSSFMYDVNIYNSFTDDVRLMYYNISYLEIYNFSDSSVLDARLFVKNFNLMILKLGEYDTIENKIILFNKLKLEKENLFSILENESNNKKNNQNNDILMENALNMTISFVNLPKIFIDNSTYNSTFILGEPSPICCFKEECYKCIDNSSSNYPVILVHGHSFNEKISAELSMESFNEMAREMEKDGYIDAGYFYGSKYGEASKGYLGRVNNSVVVEATYYLDTLVTEGDSFIFDSKWESIDIYAARLNEIVSNVKYITGKEKVIIVAHSMGSLVTRRYIQLYGEESLDRIILVGGPNHGIKGFIFNSCSVFGAEIECNEMNKNSSFMAELNNAPFPNIPVYNIVGIGCPIEGSEGDGIVESASAYLEGAENIFVNGTCRGADFFHVNMIKPSRHPEIYKIIKEFINKQN